MMMVRPEEPDDREPIHEVHAASFPTIDEARLVDALRDAQHLCISLVAVERGEVVGHVAFSPVSVPGATDGLGLAPVAVLPGFRQRGFAKRLIREGLALSEQSGYGFVVVLGDPSYYGRFDFMPAAGWRLCDEYGGGEAFQAIELRPGSIPSSGGLVRYAPAFADLTGEERT